VPPLFAARAGMLEVTGGVKASQEELKEGLTVSGGEG
tara:strand:- start:25 stop:135 length:111 start_codon:yes stop_codon:yes gene_type:complete